MKQSDRIDLLRALPALFATPLALAAGCAGALSISDFALSHFPFYFLWALIPGELLAAAVGLPVLVLLRRHIRPEWRWHVVGGGLIVAMPLTLLVIRKEPVLEGMHDGFYVFDTHHARLSSAWFGEILAWAGTTFAIGAVAGVIFWALAARPWHKARA